MGKALDLTGQRFGRLTVVSRAEKRKGRYIQWNCICECGGTITIPAYRLTMREVKSCGCLSRVNRQLSKTVIPQPRTKAQILRGASKLPGFSRGIYFLIRNKEVVYVGKSDSNMMKRIVEHWKDKKFDSFYTIDIPSGNLDVLEADYIWEFKPRYNSFLLSNGRYLGREALKQALGKSWGQIKCVLDTHKISSWLGKYDLKEFEQKGIV